MNAASTNISSTGSTPHHLKQSAFLLAAAIVISLVPSTANGQAAGGDLQAKVAAIKQSVAENQQKLHKYQWMETTQLTLNGDAKPPTQSNVPVRPRRNRRRRPRWVLLRHPPAAAE